jgi:ribose transport system ATP-binding protein
MSAAHIEPVLRINALSKRFGGTQAVDAVTLDVFAGEVLALLGENGAGKSSLIKILADVYQQDSGHITLLGMDEPQWRALPKAQLPMAFIHQDLGLVEWMTVAENIALGMGFPKRFGLIDWKAADTIARRVLARVGCDIDPRRRVFTLTRAEKSLLAIGRALDTQAKVLVLDEPTASLPMADVERLFTLLRRLRSEGLCIAPLGRNHGDF